MYKFLIVTTALMFIVAGGYYVTTAGGGIIGNIIMGDITTQDTLTPVVIEDIPGIYICNTSSTCKNNYTLTLKNDKTMELNRTVETLENESERVTHINNSPSNNNDDSDTREPNMPLLDVEKGVWEIGAKNMLVITLIEKNNTIYNIPQKIVISNVKTKTLSKISYTKSNYKDIHTMIFIKQE